ncbi:unnamed protein product [Pleuronectes platessa]|uniref:Uncharacterized protein n=1 Tax=Pleuronectes platessa TaxID=8262 RepID=A0A9N7YNA3_PLEPL|nr:unnamed protein product [Pleuronectes platessa]
MKIINRHLCDRSLFLLWPVEVELVCTVQEFSSVSPNLSIHSSTRPQSSSSCSRTEELHTNTSSPSQTGDLLLLPPLGLRHAVPGRDAGAAPVGRRRTNGMER